MDEREPQRVREDRKLEKWRIRRQKKRRQKVGDEEQQKTPKSQKNGITKITEIDTSFLTVILVEILRDKPYGLHRITKTY